MAPIMIPLIYLPITLIMLGAFMIPLVVNGATVAAAGGRRNKKRVKRQDKSFCWEMMSCEVNNLLRSSQTSEWISR
jgi:hypothetical protein